MSNLEQKMKTREYRNMLLEVKELDQEETYEVEGYATTYNQPYTLWTEEYDGKMVEVKEQVDSHAFDQADMQDVIMQYDHQGRVFARVSNNTLSLDKDNEQGLLIHANLGGTETGRQLYEEIKGGYTNKMSFGFTVAEDRVEEVRNEEAQTVELLRTITRIGKLYDVSAVSLPANDNTSIESTRSKLDGAIGELVTERLAREKREKLKAEIRAKLEGVHDGN